MICRRPGGLNNGKFDSLLYFEAHVVILQIVNNQLGILIEDLLVKKRMTSFEDYWDFQILLLMQVNNCLGTSPVALFVLSDEYSLNLKLFLFHQLTELWEKVGVYLRVSTCVNHKSFVLGP